MERRVLLVDDEPNILVTLSLVLKSHGFDVETAKSAQHAGAILNRTPFDLVITDLSMEQPLSGFEVVRLATLQRNKPATVVISGYPDLLSTWKDHGAHAGIQKPTDTEELLDTIDRLLASRALDNETGT